MSEPRRAFVRLLNAFLALALVLCGVAPSAVSAPVRRSSCCCSGTRACCPRGACCVQQGDQRAPERTASATAPVPGPRFIASRSWSLASLRPASPAAPLEAAFSASLAEDRLHLRHGVFRT